MARVAYADHEVQEGEFDGMVAAFRDYWGISEMAATMAFVTLSFSELARAFTARSERVPILQIGLFNNKVMNWAILSSLVLLLGVVYIPFLQEIFDTAPLGWAQWRVILPLLLGPSIAAELTKVIFSQYKKPK